MTANSNVFISICIPAYNRGPFLIRLFESITKQTYKDFEVIVTDDSSGEEVTMICADYKSKFNLKYYKNNRALGTPENWNEAIRKATGSWIKIMHDDDWFATESSLTEFHNAIIANPERKIFFSAYSNVHEHANKSETVYLNSFWWKAMCSNPVVLFANNIIGPPSVTVYKNEGLAWYDPKVKWVVDMDFYIRYFSREKPYYIKRPLINVGISKSQVTSYTFGIPEVQLKESLYLLNKVGEKNSDNIIVFDAFWRLLRNFAIKDIKQIYAIDYNENIPDIIRYIIADQKKISNKYLAIGLLSKILMCVSFLKVQSKKWFK